MGDIGTEQPEIEVLPARAPGEAPAVPRPAVPVEPGRAPGRAPDREPEKAPV